MKTALIFSLLLIIACSSGPPGEVTHSSGLKITEIKPNRDSQIMKQNVLHLAQVYDLTPFLYTKTIQIKSDAVSQSHPVLTLNNKYTNYPHKILAVFLHEQFHWWVWMKKKEVALAVADLKKIFPKLTTDTYIHLVVCYLEYGAVKFYLGEKSATVVFKDFIRKEKLRPWTYSQVLVNNKVLRKVFLKYKLIPETLL